MQPIGALHNKTMAIIAPQSLFDWSQIENFGDLERLKLILRHIPDEPLMQLLEKQRGHGVDKYPIRAVWNSILAGIVFQHLSIESLRRELSRNLSLAQTCGFNIFHGDAAIPSSGCYSRFMSKLAENHEELRKIFEVLLKFCYDNLDGFGENLAIDGKAIPSFARRKGTEKAQPSKDDKKSRNNQESKDDKTSEKEPDRRGDHDAAWGTHKIQWEDANGRVHEKSKSWFGYKLHLIVDTDYEMPVEFSLQPGNDAEIPAARKLIKSMKKNHPKRLKERCRHFMADRGYDDTKLNKKLWNKHQVKPVIGIKRSWKDGEETEAFGTDGVVYDNFGTVYCISPHYGDQKVMPFRGFEEKRKTLKYACPADHYGVECRDRDRCPIAKQIRIPLKTDRRIFTPVARSSAKWEKLYNKRSAAERVNSRIDNMFGFEKHTIRGLKKMNTRVTLALILMLTFAVGKTVEKKPDEVRRFLSA